MMRVALTRWYRNRQDPTVRAEFERLGVPTIDADKLARDAVADGSPGLKAVISRFGHGVLDDTGALDRRKLGSIVFHDPVARRDLEDIIHPAVRRAIDEWFASLGGPDTGLRGCCISVAVRDGPGSAEFDDGDSLRHLTIPAPQLTRIMKRDAHLAKRTRASRLEAAATDPDERTRRADFRHSTPTGRSGGNHNRQVGAVCFKTTE
jgi:dephospho-CoA kinase